jgi:membrane protein implicated in regulation of membrane protease activity
LVLVVILPEVLELLVTILYFQLLHLLAVAVAQVLRLVELELPVETAALAAVVVVAAVQAAAGQGIPHHKHQRKEQTAVQTRHPRHFLRAAAAAL